MDIIDAHSHLWLRQDTVLNGQPIRTTRNGRSLFFGEEVQMLPPFLIDGQNTAEVFLSNMDYAQVAAAVVVQELIDGFQNDYLSQVRQRFPDRLITCGMADYLHPGFLAQAQALVEQGFQGMAIPGHRLFTGQGRVPLNSDEMMRMFRLMEANGLFLSVTLADGDCQVGELTEVIQECPGLRIAVGHFGMASPPSSPPWLDEGWRSQIRLARHPNVMIESGGITWLFHSEFYPYPSAVRTIKEAADLVGWDSLMWGSDYPRTITAITYRMSYDFITKSTDLSEAEKTRFLGANAARFYRLDHLVQLPYIKNMSE